MKTSIDSTVLGSFSTVDSAPDAEVLVAALDEQASLPPIQRLRASAIELLGVRLGHHVVDVGCGIGDLARAIAGRVGSTGRVVGIDHSQVMLDEARRRLRSTTVPVELLAQDATELTVASYTFDAAVCERVFQHLAAPERAMAELVRITRPGGRVVVIDTDWGMHAIHGADARLTEVIVDAWSRNAANGLAGRRLSALFADARMRERAIVAETITSTDPLQPLRPPFTAMAAVAVGAGAVNAADAERWLCQLAGAGARGQFFWAVTLFAVAGTVAHDAARPTSGAL
jgi:ubiquinone/menaquinone biosynthesis C-methylase UbiE